MSCIITNAVSLPCRSVGGVSPEGVFIGAWQSPGANDMTIGLTSSGAIDSFSGATVSFYQMAQDVEIASLTSKPVVNLENGTAYDEITLTFNIYNFTQETQNLINAIKNGRFRVIVSGNNGLWYFLGYTNPVNLTDGTAGIGKALSDMNGASFTMVCKDPVGIKQIVSGAQNTVLVYA